MLPSPAVGPAQQAAQQAAQGPKRPSSGGAHRCGRRRSWQPARARRQCRRGGGAGSRAACRPGRAAPWTARAPAPARPAGWRRLSAPWAAAPPGSRASAAPGGRGGRAEPGPGLRSPSARPSAAQPAQPAAQPARLAQASRPLCGEHPAPPSLPGAHLHRVRHGGLQAGVQRRQGGRVAWRPLAVHGLGGGGRAGRLREAAAGGGGAAGRLGHHARARAAQLQLCRRRPAGLRRGMGGGGGLGLEELALGGLPLQGRAEGGACQADQAGCGSAAAVHVARLRRPAGHSPSSSGQGRGGRGSRPGRHRPLPGVG